MTPLGGKKWRSSGEIEKANRKKRREKYMVIYAKPNDRELATDT